MLDYRKKNNALELGRTLTKAFTPKPLQSAVNKTFDVAKTIPQPKPQYNPQTDPVYNQYAKMYTKNANDSFRDTLGQLSGLTGGRANSWAVTAASQAKDSQMNKLNDIIPQLEQINYARNYQTERDQIADQRYNTEWAQQLQQYNDYLAQQNKTNALAESQVTGYLNPYYGQKISPNLNQYSSNFAQYAQDFKNDNDPSNDYLIPQLNQASVIKMFNDPNLLQQYGGQYKTANQKALDTANALQQAQIEAANDPNSYENQKRSLELQMLAEELKRIQAVDPSFATQEAQLKLAEIQSRINENAASASASYALAQQRKNNPNGTNTDGLKYKDYYSTGMDMKQAGNYNSTTEQWNNRYTDEQIFDWVMGLGLDEESEARLIDDLGLAKVIDQKQKALSDSIKTKRYNLLQG